MGPFSCPVDASPGLRCCAPIRLRKSGLGVCSHWRQTIKKRLRRTNPWADPRWRLATLCRACSGRRAGTCTGLVLSRYSATGDTCTDIGRCPNGVARERYAHGIHRLGVLRVSLTGWQGLHRAPQPRSNPTLPCLVSSDYHLHRSLRRCCRDHQ